MTALATYQAQITEHLKHGKRNDLPSPLDAIDLLLALGTPAGYRAAERLAALLESRSEEINEFNSGYDAFMRGEPLENEFLYSTQHDVWCIGWVWAQHARADREAGE